MNQVIPFKPKGATVVVLPAKSKRPETASGIVLADVEYDPETSGTVIAVGEHFYCRGCGEDREVPFAIGDRVCFTRGAGAIIDGSALGRDGETFLLLQEDEILAVLDATTEVEVGA